MKEKIVITGGEGDISLAIKKKFKSFNVLNPSHTELDVTNLFNVIEYFDDKKPNILINNAGYINPFNIIEGRGFDWIKHFEVNLIGTVYCSVYALKNGCKKIINIGSSASVEVKPGWAAYCASKRAIVSFTESLASEGYSAVCISPGRTKTKMRKKLYPDEGDEMLLSTKEFADAVYEIFKDFDEYIGANIVVKKEKQGAVIYIQDSGCLYVI